MADFIETCITLALPVVGVWWIVIRRRRAHRRDAMLAAEWSHALALSQSSNASLVQVARVYQRARTGTKVHIRWANGVLQDAWLEDYAAANGAWILATGDVGYGEHNKNPRVFRVWYGNLHMTLPAGAPAAYTRHLKRVARQAARHRVAA
ncbi:hypothetical protein [Flexivirga oryzae]|uniref:Uncharacterized protein n=1 Tax=Flexivirga oryzae TaxID=1794944 RepID=A0A839N7T1_9MICO|nr:hypothetical protein [Flexivirga oryzae]MBB2890801.1 hypothetical protein [Flexivirga oryzae]